MKIIRFIDTAGNAGYASLQDDGQSFLIEGDIFGNFSVTEQRVEVAKTLAPIEPVCILCIGLNYRRHAEETGMALPKVGEAFLPSLFWYPLLMAVST